MEGAFMFYLIAFFSGLASAILFIAMLAGEQVLPVFLSTVASTGIFYTLGKMHETTVKNKEEIEDLKNQLEEKQEQKDKNQKDGD
jgi:hypothetical protein